MSVDLGHEFFKVAIMRQGKPLEIVLNTHSKRKTTTAVSFHEEVRVFGDDALAHQGKAPAKVPMFFHSSLGRNYTAQDVSPGGRWWSDFGLGDMFYAFDLGYNDTRGTPAFKFGSDVMHGEEVLGHLFFFCKEMAEASGEGDVIKVRDVVITVPSDASLRQRQAIAAAAEVAGLRVLTLVNEGSAFAVQRAVDYSPEQNSTELALFYNLGSRKAEATIVQLQARSTGMVKGKTAPVVTVLGSQTDSRIGGHLMDLKIAQVMLKKFQDKNPKLADGIATNPRALRKLLAQAQKSKSTLSANKVAPFIVESLFQDTDFMSQIKREEFEEMCADMFAVLTDPIEKALASANATLADLKHIEVIGGAWRVPKVQQILSDYVEKGKGEKMPLGQHLNGEESAALGAALVAANASTSFRVRKIFFTDITQHEYAVQVVALNGGWEKNLTVLYPAGAALGGKKKLAFVSEEDFVVKVFEDGVLVTEYTVTGLQDLLQGKWKDFNMTGLPKVSATVPLEPSGILELKSPTATVEELYWVNVTVEKKKANATNGTKANATNGTAGGDSNASDSSAEEKGAEAEAQADNASEADANQTEAAAAEEPEVVMKQKKKKHDKKLTVKRKDYFPAPLAEEDIDALRRKLAARHADEAEVKALAGLKNELEAAIYGSRDKLEREEIVQVTTEAQREEVTKMATELEDFMYESGKTKADYEAKLGGLQALLSPMEERALELESRSGLKESVADAVEDMRKAAAHIEKNMTWVNASKVEAASKKLADFEEWWGKKSSSQEQLPLHEAPAFTVREVNDKLAKVQKEWDKLKKTKKPKDKAPKAEKNATNASKGKGKAAKQEKLPETLEETEKELSDLREKKAAAVEAEDYDKAHSMKQREQALAKHVEKLKASKTEL